MERTIPPSKPSFAILFWLIVGIAISVNVNLANKIYATTTTSISHYSNEIMQSIYPSRIGRLTIMLPDGTTEDVSATSKNDLRCMSENIYYEAATQSYAGKLAVGQVVLNRIKNINYPSTVCGVIFEGSQNVHTSTCQFSWTCQPHRRINTSSAAWLESESVARELLKKKDDLPDITEGAIFYHADYVKPHWSKQHKLVTQIDQHMFYKN